MNKIFTNAAATYGRCVVALALGLFSSRWVLQALGATDFGLYSVVGSVVTVFSFLGGMLTISVTRNYAFAIGRAEGSGEAKLELPQWFTAAFAIHLVLALGIVAVGWPVGEWAVRHWLTIPCERVATCVWVFRLSLLAAFACVLAVPFGSMYTARQKFVKLALFGLGQTFVVFFGALWLLSATGDRLFGYAFYMTLAFVGYAVAQIAGALIEFPECRAWFVWPGRDKVRAILAFAGWTMFGSGGYMVALSGGAFVTNRFFGAGANAAYGVSQQVQYHSEQLANAMVGAFEPAVTASAGEGDGAGFRRLVKQSGLLGAGLFLLVAVPLFILVEPVLKLWLGTPPEGTASVIRIMLAAMAINRLTTGQQLALNARGRIAGWQIASGCCLLASVPLAAVLAFCGCGMAAVAWSWLVAYAGCATTNVLFARRMT